MLKERSSVELDRHCFLEGGGWLLCSCSVCIKPCEFHLEVGFFCGFENWEVSNRSSALESTECGGCWFGAGGVNRRRLKRAYVGCRDGEVS